MRPDTNNMAPSTNNMTNFYCSASVSSSDVYIAFELFESVEHFSLDECCGSSRSGCLINNGTAYKCDKTFGHINVAAICDYSTPYHINCNFTLMAPAQSQRNASTVACHIMDGVSSTSITNINTGLIIKGTINTCTYDTTCTCIYLCEYVRYSNGDTFLIYIYTLIMFCYKKRTNI